MHRDVLMQCIHLIHSRFNIYLYIKCKCKCKCNLYFKSVYQLQETPATKALGRLDRRLTVPSEALESCKEIRFSLSAPPPGIDLQGQEDCVEWCVSVCE